MTIKSDAMNLYTGYWHLSSVHRTSGAVKKGEIIGFTGNTGNVYCMIGGSWVRPPAGSRCGSHLHFFVYSYSAGNFVNPWDFLNGGGDELQACVEPGGGGDDADSCGSDDLLSCVGSASDPWGGKTTDDLGEPKLVIKKDKDDKVSYELSPRPIISYMDTVTDPGFNIAYGLALYKHGKIQYEYQKEECKGWNTWFGCWGGWEWRKKEEGEKEIDHSLVTLTTQSSYSGDIVSRFWNDTPSDGRYGYTDNEGGLLRSGRWLTNDQLPGDDGYTSHAIRLGNWDRQENCV